jgi:hypothetical protein
MTEFYSKLFPMVLINDWSCFNIEDYTIQLYKELTNNFNRNLLDIDVYINLISKQFEYDK